MQERRLDEPPEAKPPDHPLAPETRHICPVEPPPAHFVAANHVAREQTPNMPVTRSFRLSSIRTIVLIMASLIFTFAFAVLIARCLAWFIFYSIESRLGDIRHGLLRGGDMRICLCARG